MSNIGETREFGSFRDPSGAVLYLDGRVYRGVDEATFCRMRRLKDEGVLEELAEKGKLIPTKIVEPNSPEGGKLAETFPAFAFFIAHESLPFVSYPYEWTVGMLADAGLLHLDLQLFLLKRGYSLKDASAFNVTFVGTRPVFMDLPSIEVPRRYDIWMAYGQFCRMFVYPLLLAHYRGMDLRQCFLGNLSGPSVSETRRLLGRVGSLRPAAFLDVFLQHLLCATAEKRIGKSGLRGCAPCSPTAKTDSRAQELNLARLRGKLERLSLRHADRASEWSAYELTKSYNRDDETEKTSFIEAFLKDHHPQSVLDMGCNTGRYSKLAAQSGAAVVAADADHESVDVLYRSVRGKAINLQPLCVDITNPAPALGFRHRERKSFEARARFDCILALALVHHLLVAARIPLAALCEMFSSLTREWLVVEFVSPQDAMFQRLLATREDLYQDLTEGRFESEFSNAFAIVRRQSLMGGRRTLYLMRKNVP
jgi:SAM-dependent methyltransferase